MEKQILTVEFRNYKKNSFNWNKTYTIGIFDSLDEAIEKGNEVLKNLSKHFSFEGRFLKKGLFGRPKKLVICNNSNTEFYAKIETIYYSDNIETSLQEFEELE